jgi:hypothetical protein
MDWRYEAKMRLGPNAAPEGAGREAHQANAWERERQTLIELRM